MTSKTFKSEAPITEYKGKKLSTYGVKDASGQVISELIVTGSYDSFDTVAEAKDSWPSNEQILASINTKRLNTARAAAYNKAVEPFAEAYDKSPAKVRADFIAAMVNGGKSTTDAETLADSLGFTG